VVDGQAAHAGIEDPDAHALVLPAVTARVDATTGAVQEKVA
jgi:hypothetical protein